MSEIKSRSGGKTMLLLFLVVVAVVAVIFLPVQQWLHQALDWVDGLGPWGPLALGLIYVLSCVLFVPGFILTVGAGFLFGVVQGTIVVSLGSTIGATLACLVGRYLARDKIVRLVAGNARFAAVDSAVAREGFKIVLLTRLSPIFPFNLLNYAYGLTDVKISHYLLASWIGMLPGTIMYVYFGSVAEDVANVGSGEKTPAEWALTIVGFAAAVIVTVFVTRIARRALAEAAPKAAA